MSTPPAVSMQGVSFSYEKDPILQNISLEIPEGEFVGIFGPNGGGKTTFLKLLMGFLQPRSGIVTLFNQQPKKARNLIGYVPQINKVDRQFPITVEEVVLMGTLSKTTLFGTVSAKDKKQASAALEKVDMLDKKNTPFGSLSGGQSQRVLIARALVASPKILILDEPTASVDPIAEKKILSILSSLKGKTTILMVTHDLQTILEDVSVMLCVHRTAHIHTPSQVCEHFGLGLYHSPLTSKGLK